MNVVREINQLNEKELDKGKQLTPSWHDEYKDSAYIFVGGLDYGLNEGDILTVFSQFGEIVDLNLVRDKKTGQSKGFCFLCYEDQRSTILAVDNFNGAQVAGRTLRVDHCKNYKKKRPKENEDEEEFSDSDLEEEDKKYREKISKIRAEEESVPLWKRLRKYEKRQRKQEKKERKKERKRKRRKRHDSENEHEDRSPRSVERSERKRRRIDGTESPSKNDHFNVEDSKRDFNINQNEANDNEKYEEHVRHHRHRHRYNYPEEDHHRHHHRHRHHGRNHDSGSPDNSQHYRHRYRRRDDYNDERKK